MKANIRLIVGLGLWLSASGIGWCFYNPSAGRWLNRDPIGEPGVNLYVIPATDPAFTEDARNPYGFGRNDAASEWDFLGLETMSQFRKRCESTAKLNCERQGRFVSEWDVFLTDQGFGVYGYHVISYSKWTCQWKCGTCSKEEKDKRQQAKNRICNQPRTCTEQMDCFELKKRIFTNTECGKARARVMECFDGGDDIHVQERARTLQCGADCLKIYLKRDCSAWEQIQKRLEQERKLRAP